MTFEVTFRPDYAQKTDFPLFFSENSPKKILTEVNSLFALQKLHGWMENMSFLEKVKCFYSYKYTIS